MRHDLRRRFTALGTLALFVLGGNFCSFASGTATAAGGHSLAAKSPHACCAARAKNAAHEADATRESTAPCCVTIAPIVAAHAVALDATPAVTFSLAALAPGPVASFAACCRAAREDARPPDRSAATPDAGRAPPRL
jgi:hypothetical protein